MKRVAFIGLGSNLDEPVDQIQRAVSALNQVEDCRVTTSSKLYRNPPMGPANQPDYVNAAIMLETGLSARQLLVEMQRIETNQGRRRDGEHWGPRTIDLDLLLYEQEVINAPGLTVPHPGLAERAFVLQPLLDIQPDLHLPDGRSIAALLALLDSADIEAIS